MSDRSNRFNIVLVATFVPLTLLAIIGVVAGATDSAGDLSQELFLASVIVLGVDLAIIALLITIPSHSNDTTSGNTSKLDSILEAMQMSENAKQILFRDRELQLLRKTVQDDISRGEFHAALVLCDQMANIFGAVEEAEEMRNERSRNYSSTP